MPIPIAQRQASPFSRASGKECACGDLLSPSDRDEPIHLRPACRDVYVSTQMDTVAWILTALLMVAGLIGSVVPLLPGAALILAGAVVHQLMLGDERGVGWWVIAALFVMALFSYVIDFLAGSMGAKRFGASKWGAWGGVVGAIVGLFFGLPGLILGPVIGVLAGELILARKELRAAAFASWGTVVGTLLGVLGKFIVAVAMVATFWIALAWK